MTVSGTDLSHWNEHPALDSYQFVIHKATQGTGYKDSRYDERHIDVIQRGKIWGAYHFLTTAGNIEEQMHWFSSVADLDRGDIAALDFEDDNTWHTYTKMHLASLARHAMIWLMDNYPDVRVLLYCNRTTWSNIVLPYGVPLGDGLWIASPGTTPLMDWVMWQYGNGSVDYDRANFNTLSEMRSWCASKGRTETDQSQQYLLME
jgi:lysozyme